MRVRGPTTSGIRRRPSDTEAAYIAGFFDGEGCITIAPQSGGGGMRPWQVRIDFGQTDPAGIIFMESIYGGSIVRKPGVGRRRPQTRYRLSQRDALKQFLSDVLPYVREKRAQVLLVLESYFAANDQRNQIRLLEIQDELSRLKRVSYG